MSVVEIMPKKNRVFPKEMNIHVTAYIILFLIVGKSGGCFCNRLEAETQCLSFLFSQFGEGVDDFRGD